MGAVWLLVLATVGWSPLASLLEPLGVGSLLWPAIGMTVLGAILSALSAIVPWKRPATFTGTVLTVGGLLGFIAASVHLVPHVWWMHPFQDGLAEWLTRSWQPTLVLVPLVLTGLGQLLTATTGIRDTWPRRLTLALAAAWGAWAGGTSILLRPWRWSGASHEPMAHAMDPTMAPSLVATALGAALAVALVRGLWADIWPMPHRASRSPTRASITVDLPTFGPHMEAKVAARASAVLALLLAAMGAFHLTYTGLATAIAAAGAMLGLDIVARLIGRGRTPTTLTLTPTGAVVESPGWFGIHRRTIDAVDLRLDLLSTPHGPILVVSDDVVVLADTDTDALHATLQAYSKDRIQESNQDVETARAAVADLHPAAATRTAPLVLPAVRRGLLLAPEAPIALGLVAAHMATTEPALALPLALGGVSVWALGAVVLRGRWTRRAVISKQLPPTEATPEEAPQSTETPARRPSVARAQS